MSSQITTAFVKQYSAEIMHLSQQKGSKLQDKVRRESQNGKEAYYDRVGSVEAVEKTTRHSDTPQLDTPHSRRRVTLVDYVWADLIDKEDLRKLMMDPAGPYAQAAAWAMGRAKDKLIIKKANGSAYGGEEGGTEIVMPNSQKYAANNASAVSNLNVLSLRGIKQKFGDNDVDESIPLYAAVAQSQITSLLGETAVTSADFNTIRALVQGDINTFMGFEFVRTQLVDLQVDALSGSGTTGAVGSGTSLIGARRCIFWAMDGLILTTSDDIEVKIEPRPDKNYATQVFASLGIGATRMEEAKAVIGLCTEA